MAPRGSGVRKRKCFHLLKNIFPPVGFKGDLSLLEIFLVFPGVLTKWKNGQGERFLRVLLQSSGFKGELRGD